MLTANINGINLNGNQTVESLVVSYDLVCLQKTKLSDTTHSSKVLYRVLRQCRHRCFYSYFQPLDSLIITHSRAGVMAILSSRFPGASSAHIISTRTITGRYLVIVTQAGNVTYFLYNVYAPCGSQEKMEFYTALAGQCYSGGARHMILGDFNLPHEVSISSRSSDSVSTKYFNRWLASLGLDDD